MHEWIDNTHSPTWHDSFSPPPCLLSGRPLVGAIHAPPFVGTSPPRNLLPVCRGVTQVKNVLLYALSVVYVESTAVPYIVYLAPSNGNNLRVQATLQQLYIVAQLQ